MELYEFYVFLYNLSALYSWACSTQNVSALWLHCLRKTVHIGRGRAVSLVRVAAEVALRERYWLV